MRILGLRLWKNFQQWMNLANINWQRQKFKKLLNISFTKSKRNVRINSRRDIGMPCQPHDHMGSLILSNLRYHSCGKEAVLPSLLQCLHLSCCSYLEFAIVFILWSSGILSQIFTVKKKQVLPSEERASASAPHPKRYIFIF